MRGHFQFSSFPKGIRPYNFHLFFPLIFSFALCSCHDQENNLRPLPTTQEVNKQLIPSQQKFIRQETDEINQYIKLHNYAMQATPTGIRYMIYKHGKGETAKVGDYVQIAYTIRLLDDSLCYDSKKDGPREFRVGKDDVESGIHEAIQLMRKDDQALFIVPSYLAQGIAGDRDKIPPSAVVIYDITLLKIQDKP